MSASIRKYKLENEYFFVEGCHINELSNTPNDPEISIARARVESGVTTKWHRVHATTERYVIISGSGLVEIGPPSNPDISQQVNTGDVVTIPAGIYQRIQNTGSSDLIFLAICSPRFKADNYAEL